MHSFTSGRSSVANNNLKYEQHIYAKWVFKHSPFHRYKVIKVTLITQGMILKRLGPGRLDYPVARQQPK